MGSRVKAAFKRACGRAFKAFALTLGTWHEADRKAFFAGWEAAIAYAREHPAEVVAP